MNKEKLKKAGNIAVTAVCAVIFVFALFVSITALASRAKGYTNLFGYVYLNVGSGSMTGDNEDSFNEGDTIVSKELSAEEKKNLEIGKVITFWDTNNVTGKHFLNSHRISDAKLNEKGEKIYQTKGDAAASPDRTWRTQSDIVGIYSGKASGLGKVFFWLQSPTGFLVCVVVPSVLLLGYSVFLVVRAVKEYGGNKMALAKEEMKEQLLEELKKEGKLPSDKNDDKDGNDGTDL